MAEDPNGGRSASPVQRSPAAARGPRRLLLKLALCAISTLLALLGLELVVRMAGFAPELCQVPLGRFRLSANPRLGYEPVPGVNWGGDLEGSDRFYAFRGAGNSLGFRDVEHALAKPDGVLRIVVLGDSIAAGWGVERTEELFAPTLERLLAERGQRAEVINLGVVGYNTTQEVEMLKLRGLAYRPDLVLVAHCINDVEPATQSVVLATLLNREPGGPAAALAGQLALPPVLRRSAFCRWVWSGVRSRTQRGASRAPGDSVPEAFAELARLARQYDFGVLVVAFPELLDVRPYRRHTERAWVRTLANQSGFMVLDLLAPFRACAEGPLDALGSDALHPNAAGHRCAAAAMADAVARWRR